MNLAYDQPTITRAAAAALVEAAEAHASALGIAIVTVVVDAAGIPKLMSRMDGAPLMALDVARRKAVTAVGFGLPTGATWHGFVKDDPILSEGVRSIPDFTMLGGGHPVRVGEDLIGAIGVSGGHYSQDEACVQAALEALAG